MEVMTDGAEVIVRPAESVVVTKIEEEASRVEPEPEEEGVEVTVRVDWGRVCERETRQGGKSVKGQGQKEGERGR